MANVFEQFHRADEKQSTTTPAIREPGAQQGSQNVFARFHNEDQGGKSPAPAIPDRAPTETASKPAIPEKPMAFRAAGAVADFGRSVLPERREGESFGDSIHRVATDAVTQANKFVSEDINRAIAPVPGKAAATVERWVGGAGPWLKQLATPNEDAMSAYAFERQQFGDNARAEDFALPPSQQAMLDSMEKGGMELWKEGQAVDAELEKAFPLGKDEKVLKGIRSGATSGYSQGPLMALNPILSIMTMSAGSGADEFANQIVDGRDPELASAKAGFTAFAEYLSEKLPIDMAAKWAKSFLAKAAVYAAGDVPGELANNAANAAIEKVISKKELSGKEVTGNELLSAVIEDFKENGLETAVAALVQSGPMGIAQATHEYGNEQSVATTDTNTPAIPVPGDNESAKQLAEYLDENAPEMASAFRARMGLEQVPVQQQTAEAVPTQGATRSIDDTVKSGGAVDLTTGKPMESPAIPEVESEEVVQDLAQEPKVVDYEKSKEGDTTTIYDSNGDPQQVKVVAISKSGTRLVEMSDGTTVPVGVSNSSKDPRSADHVIESAGVGAQGKPVSELGTSELAELEHALDAHPARGTNQGVATTVAHDLVAVRAEQQRRRDQAMKVDAAANEAATSEFNDRPEPTKGQMDAGTYKKGHIRVQGLDIAIENPAGSIRKDKETGGQKWQSQMQHHYGYIKRSKGITEGGQSSKIDVFVGSNPGSQKVFVIDQKDPGTGKFDEHKVMMGFDSIEDAEAAYRSNYPQDWDGIQNITETTPAKLKAWINKGGARKRPFNGKKSASPALTKTPSSGNIVHKENDAEAMKALEQKFSWENVDVQDHIGSKNLRLAAALTSARTDALLRNGFDVHETVWGDDDGRAVIGTVISKNGTPAMVLSRTVVAGELHLNLSVNIMPVIDGKAQRSGALDVVYAAESEFAREYGLELHVDAIHPATMAATAKHYKLIETDDTLEATVFLGKTNRKMYRVEHGPGKEPGSDGASYLSSITAKRSEGETYDELANYATEFFDGEGSSARDNSLKGARYLHKVEVGRIEAGRANGAAHVSDGKGGKQLLPGDQGQGTARGPRAVPEGDGGLSVREAQIEYRETATPEDVQNGQDLLAGLDRRAKRNGSLLANAIATDFKTAGTSYLLGKRVESPADLATLAQVYRNPSFETFRIVYVKGGAVVGHTGITSRLPGAAAAFVKGENIQNAYRRMRDQMSELGADGYYLLHNHPSGNVRASQADANLTGLMAQNVPGLIDHVIINHNRYFVLSFDGGDSLTGQEKKDWISGEIDKSKIPSKPHALLGRLLTGGDDVVLLGKEMEIPSESVLLVSRTATSQVNGLMVVSLEEATGKRGTAIIRRFARQTGGASVIAVLNDIKDLRGFDIGNKGIKALEQNILLDIVDKNGHSVASQGVAKPADPSKMFGQNITGRFVKEDQADYERAGVDYASTEKESVGDVSGADGERVDPVAGAEAARQVQALNRGRVPEQTVVTIKEAQDWLEAHGFPRIAPQSQTNKLIDQLRQNEDFKQMNIFDQIRLAAQLERPIRKRDYNSNSLPKANRKLQGQQGGNVRAGANQKVAGSGVVAADTIRGCDHFCFECYALKGAAQGAISHQHPVLQSLSGTIQEGEILRLGETGDPSRNWAWSDTQVRKVIEKSQKRGAKVTYDDVFYITKLLNLDGYNPETARNLQVTLDPLMPAHMWISMENILRLKSAHPEVNINVRIRSVATQNQDLQDATDAAVEFANRFKLPVIETRMRFIRNSSLDLLMLDKGKYKKDGNQFKLKQGELKEQADQAIVCDEKSKGCPGCMGCARTTKDMRSDNLKNQSAVVRAEGIDGVSLDESVKIFDQVGGDVMFSRANPVGSDSFNDWFGKSAVRNIDGTPKVVYHATQATGIESFRKGDNDLGIHFGTAEQANDRAKYTSRRGNNGRISLTGNQNLIPVYLSIQNPLVLQQDPGSWDINNLPFVLENVGIDISDIVNGYEETIQRHEETLEEDPNDEFAAEELREYQEAFSEEVRGLLEDLGYDGIQYVNTGEIDGMAEIMEELDAAETSEQRSEIYERKKALEESVRRLPKWDDSAYSYIAFYPTQVKSVFNQGAYDRSDPRILFSRSWYYSPLSKAMDRVFDQKSMTGSQLLAKLEKAKKKMADQVKQEEIDAIGLEEYLELNTDTVLTKDQVQEFIDQHGVEIVETVKGEEYRESDDEMVDIIRMDAEQGELPEGLSIKEETEVGTGVPIYTVVDESGEQQSATSYSEQGAIDSWLESYLEDMSPSIGEATKYAEYTLPGGENYREILLRLPGAFGKARIKDGLTREDVIEKVADAIEAKESYVEKSLGGMIDELMVTDDVMGVIVRHMPNAEIEETFESLVGERQDQFKSNHWDEPNILAHMRINTRTVNGEKVLFIEEIQSDWALQVRRHGFNTYTAEDSRAMKASAEKISGYVKRHMMENPGKYVNSGDMFSMPEVDARDWLQKNDEAYQQLIADHQVHLDKLNAGDSRAEPYAPFVGTSAWQNLVLKRLIRLAAEEGHDRIAWVTGEQTAERYSLDKKLSKIVTTKNNDGTYDLAANNDEGRTVVSKKNLTESALEDTVGKEIASRIIEKHKGDQGAETIDELMPGWEVEQFEHPDGYDLFVVLDEQGDEMTEWERTEEEAVARAIREYNANLDAMSPAQVLTGDDLKIEAKWARNLYDRAIPKFMEKFGKRYGVSTEPITAGGNVEPYRVKRDESGKFVLESELDPGNFFEDSEGFTLRFDNINEAHAFAENNLIVGASQQLSMPVTAEMREDALTHGMPLFGKGDSAVAGVAADELRTVIGKITQGFGLGKSFEVVATESELPQHIVDFIASQSGVGAIEGVFDPRSGKMYLVADSIDSTDRAAFVVLHEAGHYGFDRLMGKAGKQLLNQIYLGNVKEAQRIALQYGFDLKTAEGRRQSANEIIANEFAKREGRNAKVIERVIAKVREWIRSLGVNLKLSDSEISVLVERMAKAIRRDGGLDPNGSPQFMTAWHGTPHTVDKFSTSKIGTGEGNQAYGYGLYFASNRKVAEFYKERLSVRPHLEQIESIIEDGEHYKKDTPNVTAEDFVDYLERTAKATDNQYMLDVIEVIRNDKPFGGGDGNPSMSMIQDHLDARYIEGYVWDVLDEDGNPVDDFTGFPDKKEADFVAEDEMDPDIENYTIVPRKIDPQHGPGYSGSNLYTGPNLEEILMMAGGKKFEAEGKVYQVELAPQEDEYLLWDEPLSKQSEKVKAAIIASGKMTWYFYNGSKYVGMGPGSSASDALERWNQYAPDNKATSAKPSRDKKGGEFYEDRVSYGKMSPMEASSFLHSLGIRGIKYLDGSSRSKGEGNHNYVIFHEDDVEITGQFSRRPVIGPESSQGWARGRLDWIRQKLQDKFLVLKRTQESLEEQGWQKSDQADAYLQETLMHGKAELRIETFEKEHVEPLLKAIAASDVTLAELEEYLYAMHAPERNAYIQAIDMEREEGGSGMTDREARQILARFRNDGKLSSLEDLAERVYAMTAMQRQILRDSGLEPEARVEAWEQWQNYIPLKGFEDPRDTDFGPTTGSGFNVKGSGTKKTLGRDSRATDLIANAVAQVEQAIVRSEKAEVGRAFLRMVEENPDPNLWKLVEPGDGSWPQRKSLEQNPEHAELLKRKRSIERSLNRRNLEEDHRGRLNELLEEINAQIEDVPQGVIRMRPDPMFAMADNVLAITRDNGEIAYVEIKNQDLARNMKNLNPAMQSKLLQGMATVNRYLSMINTSLNPEFVITNLERDLQTAMINLSGEHSAKVAGTVLKRVAPAMLGIRNALRKENAHGEWVQWYERFRAAGAKVGFMDFTGVEARQRKMQATIKAHNRGPTAKTARNVVNAIGEFIDDYNTAVENAARLATFRTMIENGMSEDRAAQVAKELTVNFNRKGEVGPAMNALYMFFNAGVQGSARIMQAMKSKRVRKTVGAITVLAIGLAQLARLMGGEDDDGEDMWDKISDVEKESNLIFMNPDGSGDYFKIKMPYGYNVFAAAGYAISDAVTHMATGGKKGKSVAEEAAFMFDAGMNAFNPLGGSGSILQTMSPTLTDPMVQIGENKAWHGGPVMPPQSGFGPKKPYSQLYWNSARPASVAVTKWLNEITGGDEWEPGLVDISPEWLDLYWDTYTGGMGRFYNDLFGIGAAAATGDDVPVRRIPFARKVYSEKSEMVDTQNFYEALETIERRVNMYEDLREAREHREASKYRSENPEIRLESRVKTVRKQLKTLRGQLDRYRDKGDKDGEKRVMEKMNQVQLRFLRQYNETVR